MISVSILLVLVELIRQLSGQNIAFVMCGLWSFPQIWGLDISNGVGFVTGEGERWRAGRGQGRRFLAFIWTLDAAPLARKLESEERSTVVFLTNFVP